MLTVTKKFDFSYGHRLPEYDGKCAEFHGHNAKLAVVLSGGVRHSGYTEGRGYWERWQESQYPSMVIDFSFLSHIVQEEIIAELDHKDLTTFFKGKPPTAETMAAWIWRELERVFGSHLQRIDLSETPDSWVTIMQSDRTEADVVSRLGRRE